MPLIVRKCILVISVNTSTLFSVCETSAGMVVVRRGWNECGQAQLRCQVERQGEDGAVVGGDTGGRERSVVSTGGDGMREKKKTVPKVVV